MRALTAGTRLRKTNVEAVEDANDNDRSRRPAESLGRLAGKPRIIIRTEATPSSNMCPLSLPGELHREDDLDQSVGTANSQSMYR